MACLRLDQKSNHSCDFYLTMHSHGWGLSHCGLKSKQEFLDSTPAEGEIGPNDLNIQYQLEQDLMNFEFFLTLNARIK